MDESKPLPPACLEACLRGAPHCPCALAVVPELALIIGQRANQRARRVVKRVRAVVSRHGRRLFHIHGLQRFGRRCLCVGAQQTLAV